MPKRTYQPKKLARKRKCGYRARAATKEGRKMLKERKLRGRWKLTQV
ncbi:MAG: 50S ribosomal protein L34 [Chloroflexi bacterium RBG_16_48_7]|nr:MAG: 50S ribosomal protein L34 [Chloroflexi bacterium RBG_16_48_7]